MFSSCIWPKGTYTIQGDNNVQEYICVQTLNLHLITFAQRRHKRNAYEIHPKITLSCCKTTSSSSGRYVTYFSRGLLLTSCGIFQRTPTCIVHGQYLKLSNLLSSATLHLAFNQLLDEPFYLYLLPLQTHLTSDVLTYTIFISRPLISQREMEQKKYKVYSTAWSGTFTPSYGKRAHAKVWKR